jgi:hypothetical protein
VQAEETHNQTDYLDRCDRGKGLSDNVVNVLCAARNPVKRAEPTSRSRPARERTQQAITVLYAQRVPSPAVLPNVLLCRRVGEKLKELGLGRVSDDCRPAAQLAQQAHCGACAGRHDKRAGRFSAELAGSCFKATPS